MPTFDAEQFWSAYQPGFRFAKQGLGGLGFSTRYGDILTSGAVPSRYGERERPGPKTSALRFSA